MTLPLADEYPGIARLARVELAALPTPLQDLPALAESHGIGALAIKRDDLTSARYGGNKVRKLEFLLGLALAEERRAVITFGAYGSNHALATAVHALGVGLEPHVVLSPQAPGPFAAATLLAHASLGTLLYPIDGWDGAREAVRVRRMLRERDGIDPLVIPMGGTSDRGATGYVNAAFEIAAQVQAGVAPRPDFVYAAGGTLGTVVGLAVGFAALRWSTEVVSVRVTPGEVANELFARRIAAETIALLRSADESFPDIAYDDLALDLRDDWFEPGYGVVTPETLAAVAAAAEYGFSLETTYTGKALAAMMADAAEGLLEQENVLFLDTYNSAPMPTPGSPDALAPVLREYVKECEQLFGRKSDSEGMNP
ncbi:MAG: pyridoxal-phosphate dependent enzyme [Actinomycetota bacterium]|nr:pyridoxal-phosphate dependent enzyme [Actinomycetota bacterium]